MGVVAWALGGAAAMLVMGLALAREMRDFPGGAAALAASVLPAAEAMRPLRWPAERLDTLGGYLTFHNIMLVQGFLAIYAAIQGARAIRGFEDRHALEQVLATGWSRTAVLRDRALGFVIALVLITVGIASGVALTMAVADVSDIGGSFVTMTAVGLCSLVAYSLGLLISQVLRTSRAAAGVSVMILLVLYVGTNSWEQIGALGVIRYVSPFYYANFSRALVPGHGIDLGSMLVLLLTALALAATAAVAFSRRDYGAALWTRRREATDVAAPARVQRWWLRSVWSATLVQHRLGLLAWALCAAAFTGLMMALQPSVMDAWALFDFMAAILGGGPGASPEILYASMTVELVAPVIVAFVIVQSSGWVADLDEGRVEQVLSVPVSWTRLVWERLLSASIGALVISLAAVAAVIVGSIGVGSSVDAAGVGRLLSIGLLLGWSVAALAAICVAAFRSGVAVTVLALYVGAAYLLTWLIPMFEWPAWVSRLSIFEAFGHPYQEWPAWGGIVLLLVLAVPGSLLAARIAEHTPKVP